MKRVSQFLCPLVFRTLTLSSTMSVRSPKVLSIQSHVVSGYVGNKSATFPLQLLGFEVDAINSVQFSNHTGYGKWKGDTITEQNLADLVEGLAENDLDNYTHLLTGYARSASFLMGIAAVLKQLRAKNPNLIYVCDPVMGDDRKMYCPFEVLSVYRDVLVPLADVVTPNQSEVEFLTGKTINSIDDALEAFDTLHEKGVKVIVMSSSNLGPEDELLCLSSSIKDGRKEVIQIGFPRLAATFTGTGDLFAALLLAWLWKEGSLKKALEHTIATIQAVLTRTLSLASGDARALSCAEREIKLIQSKEVIEKPVVKIHAEIYSK